MLFAKKRCPLLNQARVGEGKLMQKAIREGTHDILREQSPTDRGPSWTLVPQTALPWSHL